MVKMDIIQFSVWNYRVTETNNWLTTKPLLKRIGSGIGDVSVRVSNDIRNPPFSVKKALSHFLHLSLLWAYKHKS